MYARPAPTARPLPVTLLRCLALAVVATIAATLLTAPYGTGNDSGGTGDRLRPLKAGPNPVTPGNFTGYGFDQCLAPTQQAMDRWLNYSPFLAAGIYISGNSRACRHQPNITPTWIRTQLRKGWRLLPITLGPQASCHPGFPRYDDDPKIDPRPGSNGTYWRARRQGRNEAEKTVSVAKNLGFAPSSTLWYDLEGFDLGNTRCRESALAFLSAWTVKIRGLGFKSGVYSSAGSGIKMLDDARVERPGKFALPDMIWIARWDGQANTSTSYIREDGWRPGGRVKQYRGGHHETWGGVTINIDSNYLDVGKGSVAAPESHCGGVPISFRTYGPLRPATADYTPSPSRVTALQCLLKERGLYDGKLNGVYNAATVAGARTWQGRNGFDPSDTFSRKNWVAILSQGAVRVSKIGSAGPAVRRLQRALNAVNKTLRRPVTGLFTAQTAEDVRGYQRRVEMHVSGVANTATWSRLQAGAR